MKKWVYYYFYKMLNECVDILEDMDISEEKRDELSDDILNICDKLRGD